MEYLTRVLGIHVAHLDDADDTLPGYMQARYRIQRVTLDGKEAIFLYPKTELDAVSTVKKHIARLQREEGMPVVLVLDRLPYRQREYLLHDRIPFVVPEKQIYLPFMAVLLQERCDAEKRPSETMLPSAQMLMLHYLYQGGGELSCSKAARQLDLTPTSISRASRQLEEFGLVKAEKQGVQKILLSNETPQALFERALPYFENPVRRTIYVPKSDVHEKLLLSGESALAEYSMLNPPAIETWAAYSIAEWKQKSTVKLQNADTQCAIELWRHDPKKLSYGSCVDQLSLAVEYRATTDERIEASVEEILKQVWRETNGKGN